MASSSSSRDYKCEDCGRAYLRSSHLRRHQATHSAAQKECPYCHRHFLRSDVLLRHARACRQKDMRTVPRGQKRGRKRISCDQCFRTHNMCDGDYPCEACLAASVKCSYIGFRQSSPSPVLQHSIAEGVSSKEAGNEATDSSERVSIPFLLNYTNQSSKSSYDLHCILGGESSSFIGDSSPSSDPFPELWSSLFYAFINPSAVEPRYHSTPQHYGLGDSISLAATVERLISHLERCAAQDHNPQKVDTSAARSFFCIARLREYVQNFFDHSPHTNCVIHRASFNVNTVSTHLLLVVILLGAVCTSPEDAIAAQQFAELLQHSFFEGPEFQQILYGKHPPRSTENIQIVQAVMLFTVLQSTREEFHINRRIRTQWFPALVSVVRSLGLTQVMNGMTECGQTGLADYMCQETLVRMMAWVYLLDSYNVIFYRSPPQLKMIEANFSLPRNDSVFNSMDPIHCEYFDTEGEMHCSPLSLKSAVQLLMDENPVTPKELLRHINTLFALTLTLSAIHSILFDIQALGGYLEPLNALAPIIRALDRWKELYDLFHSELLTSKQVKAGFMIHNLEFWWLAKRFVQHPDLALNHQRFATDSIENFYSMVQDLKNTHQPSKSSDIENAHSENLHI